MSRIYLSSPDVTELEERYVLGAIRSGWVAPLGPDVDAFEQEIANRIGSTYAVALSSGTAALHLALVAWGVGHGDIVPTSTMTFTATTNAIAYTGATPYLVDIDRKSGNIDPSLLDQVLAQLRNEGAHVPCIVPVDLLGKAANYTSLSEVATRHGVRILADAAESLGASHAGRPAGAWGDASVLSFNGNKIMTTSGGGMLLTDDEDLAQRIRFLATQAREPVIHYEHEEIGYNYRMSNLLAALGRAQLERLDTMIARRRALRDQYAALFRDLPGVRIFGRDSDERDNCWLTAILVDASVTGWSPNDLLDHLAQRDIEARPLWKPMHLQPVHQDKPAHINGVSEKLFEQGLSLPSGSGLTGRQVDEVRTAINDFLRSR